MIKRLKLWFKQLNCCHELQFVRNIHGDEIIYTDSRSTWKCSKCGKLVYSPEYIDTEEAKEITRKWYRENRYFH